MIWKRYRKGLINGKCLLTLASQKNLKRYCFLRKGVKINVCGLQLGPNFGMRLTAYKNFYLPLTIEKIHVLIVVTKKYLRSYGCSGTNFTAAVRITNPKTGMQIEIIKTQIIAIQIYFLIKRILLLNGKPVGSQLINWLSYKILNARTTLIKNILKKE